MNDMSAIIVPKSDQISSDDFLAGPKTYTIEAIAINPGTEQPVNIKLEGEPRVWRPCKSMSRVLVSAWGPDASVYAGRSLTLYRDPKVKWGGMEVGGIRVSHMSHITGKLLLQLTATKGKRTPHVVEPLIAEIRQIAEPTPAQLADFTAKFIANVNRAPDADTLNGYVAKQIERLDKLPFDLRAEADEAVSERLAVFHPMGARDTEDMGEGFTEEAE